MLPLVRNTFREETDGGFAAAVASRATKSIDDGTMRKRGAESAVSQLGKEFERLLAMRYTCVFARLQRN